MKDRINVVPEKETETLRDKIRWGVRGQLEIKRKGVDLSDCEIVDLSDEIMEAICDALSILPADQDRVGAKVVVNPKVIISINGGCAEVIEGEGQADIEIRDYDVMEDADEWNNIYKDEDGNEYQSMKF